MFMALIITHAFSIFLREKFRQEFPLRHLVPSVPHFPILFRTTVIVFLVLSLELPTRATVLSNTNVFKTFNNKLTISPLGRRHPTIVSVGWLSIAE